MAEQIDMTQLRYGEAMEELELILDQIESDEVEIDELAGKVARARELIQACRGTIERTEMQVREIAEELKAGRRE